MKLIRQFIGLFVITAFSTNLSAQQTKGWSAKPDLEISGFADVFYAYDFNQPPGDFRQSFLYNHNRHNEFNLNLGYLKLGLQHSKYRANVALQTGTYANDNYAEEPGVLKNILEANVGISLTEKNNLWLDAGVFPSHIGFESAVSIENPTLTRSLLAENSPYFLSGVKLTYNPNEKWEIAGLVVNGWQRIQRLTGNSLLSFGTQLSFTPSEKVLLNWSTFLGTDDPDVSRRMRYFNNFYGKFQVTERFNLTTGFDIGLQQRTKNGSTYETWFSPIVIGELQLDENWKTALRAEYYQDRTGIIIPTATATGFRTTGLSLNLDYSPAQHVMARVEGRWLDSRDAIFRADQGRSDSDFTIVASLAIKFSKKVND